MDHPTNRSTTRASYVLFLAAALLLTAGFAHAIALLPQLERASLTAAGQQANQASLVFADPALDSRRLLSQDGRYVVFDSIASNLVPNDLNGKTDVFIRDRLAEVTERVSVDSAGDEALGDSYSAEVSADGRFVVFASAAANLDPPDLNDASDVFLHDRLNGTTTRLSVALGGGDPDGASSEPAISADGSTVAFASLASNLVADDDNGLSDVFVVNVASGITQRVSLSTAGDDPDAPSASPALSGDGGLVVFVSRATNLVSGDQPFGVDGIFLFERSSGATTKVSTRWDGTHAIGWSRHPVLSADGRWIAFSSSDWHLVESSDPDGAEDVFLFDLEGGGRTLITAGHDRRRRSSNPSLSDDGRFVAFASRSRSILTNGNGFNGTDVYVYDHATGETTRASRGFENGRGKTDGDSCSELPTLSGDGRLIAFKSTSTNLVAGDTNEVSDVFVGLAGFSCQASEDCETEPAACYTSPGVCNLGERSCIFQERPDGTSCHDGNTCTAEAACEDGVCTRRTLIACEPLGECFLAGTCNPATGSCSNPLAPNGTSCGIDPGVTCSAPGSCRFGRCDAGPGSEDTDGDLICSADDNCPSVPNPEQSDVDFDEEGDVCDHADGEIRISRARLRWSRTATSENGTVGVWGELRNPVGAGPFPSDETLKIRLRDGVQVDFAFTFAASDCRRLQSGTIVCRSEALRGVTLTLQPEQTAGGVESFRVKLRAAGLDIPGPFQPPVALSITRDPPAERLGIDCYGEILSCRSTARGLRCSAP